MTPAGAGPGGGRGVSGGEGEHGVSGPGPAGAGEGSVSRGGSGDTPPALEQPLCAESVALGQRGRACGIAPTARERRGECWGPRVVLRDGCVEHPALCNL